MFSASDTYVDTFRDVSVPITGEQLLGISQIFTLNFGTYIEIKAQLSNIIWGVLRNMNKCFKS